MGGGMNLGCCLSLPLNTYNPKPTLEQFHDTSRAVGNLRPQQSQGQHLPTTHLKVPQILLGIPSPNQAQLKVGPCKVGSWLWKEPLQGGQETAHGHHKYYTMLHSTILDYTVLG